MLVADAMTTEVVTRPVDDTLADVVGAMLEHDVGSVVLTRAGDPTGIVTRTDVLRAAHERGDPIAAIPVEAAMSHPLVTVEPKATVRAAVERMGAEGVKRLAVVRDLELVGVIAHTDVVRNHAALLREAIGHEERRQRLEE